MKRTLIGIVAFTMSLSLAPAQPTATINLVNHNIHSGGRAQAAADHIEDLMALSPQKALILLQEANYARQYFTLPHSGWHHIWPASPHEGRGNPIFTRDAVATMLDSWAMSMQQPWTHNQPKDPRVYSVALVQLVSTPWVKFHCINVHFPTNRTGNGPARQESIDRLVQFSQQHSDLPLIICGDFNMSAANVQQNIGNAIGGQIYSDTSVDHIIMRDGKDVSITSNVVITKLGLMGSDHQALRYNFTFQLKNIVVDNNDTSFTTSTNWGTGTSATDKYGSDYRFRATEPTSDPATWNFNVPAAGNYEIFAWWSQGANRSITAPYILPDSTIIYRNQQTGGGSWQSLGTRTLATGPNNIQLSCWTSNGTIVLADAIRLVPQ